MQRSRWNLEGRLSGILADGYDGHLEPLLQHMHQLYNPSITKTVWFLPASRRTRALGGRGGASTSPKSTSVSSPASTARIKFLVEWKGVYNVRWAAEFSFSVRGYHIFDQLYKYQYYIATELLFWNKRFFLQKSTKCYGFHDFGQFLIRVGRWGVLSSCRSRCRLQASSWSLSTPAHHPCRSGSPDEQK